MKRGGKRNGEGKVDGKEEREQRKGKVGGIDKGDVMGIGKRKMEGKEKKKRETGRGKLERGEEIEEKKLKDKRG